MNLIDELHQRIAEQPDAEAVYVWGNPGRSVSFGELGQMVAHHKTLLLNNGLKRGDHLAVLIPDELLDLVIYLSLTEIGVGSYIPSTRHEAFHCAKIFSIERLLILEDDNQLKFRIIGPKPKSAISPDHGGENPLPWMLRTTSGTTGTPKCFVVDQQMAVQRRLRYYDSVNIGRGDRFFSYSPLRLGAPRQRYFYALCAGASVVLGQNLGGLNDLIAAINECGVTHLYCVPVHLSQLCDFIETKEMGKDLPLFPDVKCIEATSAIVQPSLRQRVEHLLCPRFHIAYSISEVGHISSTRKSTAPDSDMNDVGVAVDGVTLAIFDDDRKQAKQGESGEIGILLSGDSAEARILKSIPAGSPQMPPPKEPTESKNWYMTGDIGFFSKNGNLIHLGRKDDMIIYKGSNIYPAEIERVALEDPAVSQAVAFGVPHESFGELPCLVVQLKSPQSLENLFKHCRAHLDYRAPVFMQVMPEFPTNQMGKPLRRKIIETFKPVVESKFNQA